MPALPSWLSMLVICCVLLLAVATGIFSQVNRYSTAAILALYLMSLMALVLFKLRQPFIERKLGFFWLSGAFLTTVYIISYLRNDASLNIVNIIVPIGAVSFVCVMQMFTISALLSSFFIVMSITSILNGFFLVRNLKLTENPGVFMNANTSGVFCIISLLLSLLIIVKSRKLLVKYISTSILVISSVGVLLSSSRSCIISLAAFSLIYLIWPRIRDSRWMIISVILLMFSLIFSSTYLYPNLNSYSWFEKLDAVSTSYTNKSVFSGRDVIWNQIIDLINQRPVLGYGPGVRPIDFIYQQSELSAHNLYLQTALQSGVLGLIALLLLLVSLVFLCINTGKYDNFYYKICVSFIFLLMVYQTLEISLTQNNIHVGLLQWFMIGLLLKLAIDYGEEGSVYLGDGGES